MSNGWHTTSITGRNAAYGGHRTYRLTYRTQAVECCGQRLTLIEVTQ
jgi:hypothetical protein